MLAITRITGQITGIAVLGAIWAARVAAITGSTGDASEAPATAQTAALQDTILVVVIAMAGALALALWGWNVERRERQTSAQAPKRSDSEPRVATPSEAGQPDR